MSQRLSGYRPPHPRLAFRIGFTGHRTGPRLVRGADELREDISGVLQAVIGGIAAVKPVAWSHAPAQAPDIRMLNGVATGADTIAAEAARAAGLFLECVLPFSREDYLAQDFPDPADRRRCEALLDDADSASVFSLAMARGERIDWRGYRAVGEVIADNCDLLLAVWDGQDSGQLGGAEDVVRMAIEQETPVIVIDASPGGPIRLLHDDTVGAPVSIDAIQSLVARMLTPPKGHGHDRRMNERQARERYFTEDRAGGAARLGRLFPWHKASRLLTRVARLFANGGSDAGLPPLTLPSGRVPPPEPSSTIIRHFATADAISTKLGHVYRSSFTILYLLSALAVMTGLGAVFDFKNMEAKAWLVLAELFVILAIILLFTIGRRQSWHHRWLDTRRIAELLRVAGATVPLAGGAQRGSGASASDEWTEWYVRAVLRESRLPAGVTATPAYLHGEVRRFVTGLLDDQIRYHHANVHAMRRLHGGLDHLGMGLLVISGGLGAAYVIMVMFHMVDTHDHHSVFAEWFKPLVTFASAGLPALGAALYGIRAQGDYEATAERSDDTLEELLEVRRSLLHVLEKPNPEFTEVRAELAWAAEVMQSDLTLWRSLYRSRPLMMLA